MQYVRIGLINKPQGIKGEVKITVLSDDKNRFDNLSDVFIEQDGMYSPMKIRSSQRRMEYVYAFFEGIDERNQAEKLRNAYICVDHENVLTLPKDSYYIFDLIGCEIFLENGDYLGKLKDVLTNSSTDIYNVQGNNKSQDFMIPVLKKLLVDVDIKSKKIIFDAKTFEQTVCYLNEDTEK